MKDFHHESVMLKECIEALRIRADGVYIDATLGGAGHAKEIASRLHKGGRLIAIDRDEDAITNAQKRLYDLRDRVTLVKSDFRHITTVAKDAGVPLVDGILFDLGVSSYQLDEKVRGFSYMNDGPLDMRMDKTQDFSAYELINTWGEDKLKQIFFQYGEERYSQAIAAKIVKMRAVSPVQTTGELSDLIISAVPGKARKEKQHPAKRVFQAVRIAVNDELSAVSKAISDAVSCLRSGGRIAVISFHSLEDRIVKSIFLELNMPCTCPKDFPVCVCGKKRQIALVSKKPICAQAEEIEHNPRARSAKLRIAQKL